MSIFPTVSILLVLVMTISSCDNTPQITESEAREQIIDMHEEQRRYHFEKMSREFAEQLSAEHISVNHGAIATSSVEENAERFSRYFNAVEFEKWDDLSEPVIRFSDDLSMAYTVVHKMVAVNYPGDNGELIRDSTEYAWVAIYRRLGDEWSIECVASTQKTSEH